mgnify:CR=1 FL=1
MKITLKFANAVLQSRKELGYTQSEVAEAVSISVRWFQKIESGQRMPSAITTLRIVLFLQLDIEDFREEVGLVDLVSSI